MEKTSVEMRAVFCDLLDKYMEKDENIVVVDADLSKPNGTFPLRKKYPERALDVGIAEQNMASVAAGMTSFGFKPFITSFTPFATRRIADQVAISISYAKRNVKIVGTDPGITAENNGGTHMSMEDLGIMRTIPGITVFQPIDTVQLEKAMPFIIDFEGPMYIRMCRKKVTKIFDEDYKFDFYKADVMSEGSDVTLIASGIMVEEAILAAEELAGQGVSAEVIAVHTIKPIDADTILASAKKTGAIVTVENHSVVGGLFSAVSECIVKNTPVPMVPVGVQDRFGEVGLMPYLKDAMHLNVSDVVAAAKQAIEMKK